jgi:AraC-like DNA-binding protein
MSEAWIVSSMPRGGLQIIQPSHLPQDWVKSYAREFHTEDAVTWRAIAAKEPMDAERSWPGGAFEQSHYYQKFLRPARVRYLAAAPLEAPLLEGYAGAIHVHRNQELGDFTDAELRVIDQTAKEVDRLAAAARAGRGSELCANPPPWMIRPRAGQLIVDSSLQLRTPESHAALESRVAEQLMQDARRRLKDARDVYTSDRLVVPDSDGQLCAFRVVYFPKYPALGGGSFVFYCLQPACCDWLKLRASDFAADPELARLVGAMQFMHQEFGRGPSLSQIAETVHLSAFHFHRRFTELLGITPKHFLLECQIFQAKRTLMSGDQDLAGIAKSCGFAHQSHFTSRFKQATGLTPTRWRKWASML